MTCTFLISVDRQSDLSSWIRIEYLPKPKSQNFAWPFRIFSVWVTRPDGSISSATADTTGSPPIASATKRCTAQKSYVLRDDFPWPHISRVASNIKADGLRYLIFSTVP